MSLLVVGSAVGVVVGVLHGVYLYRRAASAGTFRARARAAYLAGWALILWTAFGTYLLVLWVAGTLGYAVHLVRRRDRVRARRARAVLAGVRR